MLGLLGRAVALLTAVGWAVVFGGSIFVLAIDPGIGETEHATATFVEVRQVVSPSVDAGTYAVFDTPEGRLTMRVEPAAGFSMRPGESYVIRRQIGRFTGLPSRWYY